MSEKKINEVPSGWFPTPTPSLLVSYFREQAGETRFLKAYKELFKLQDENLDMFRLIVLEVHMRLEEQANAVLSLRFLDKKASLVDWDFFVMSY